MTFGEKLMLVAFMQWLQDNDWVTFEGEEFEPQSLVNDYLIEQGEEEVTVATGPDSTPSHTTV